MTGVGERVSGGGILEDEVYGFGEVTYYGVGFFEEPIGDLGGLDGPLFEFG